MHRDLRLEDKFFILLQSSVRKKIQDDLELREDEWAFVYEMADKQSLLGLIFEALEELSKHGQKPPEDLLYDWFDDYTQITTYNSIIDKQCLFLKDWFANNLGCGSCILKGQGVARLYPNPSSRQSGDIDIWVDARRDNIVKELKKNFIGVSYIDYVNCHASYFQDTEVEVHFRPTWMFNPFTNLKVQKWIQKNKDKQMANFDPKIGFNYPTIGFNLVFSLIHIYRHVFFEGIGLRQITDYYFILKHSTLDERHEAFSTLKSFGLMKFVASIMYIMQRVFDIERELMLCSPNVSEGDFLLSEILRSGNFGKYDDRINRISDEHRWRRGIENVKRNLRFLWRYPSEVLWMPVWKLWHWCWRKYKGYL